MSQRAAFLKNAGLLNVEAPDISELLFPRRLVSFAYCESDRCCSYREKVIEKGKERMILKRFARLLKSSVSKSAERCPDCGHFLIWKHQ